MDTGRIEKAIARGIELLGEFLPGAARLYFPLLHSVCVWAVRRIFNVRQEILAWQVWLEPEAIETKSDEFIASFFRRDERLRQSFGPELESEDKTALREAFAALYPVLGLEDVFLKDLFRAEIGSGEFRRIVSDFRSRIGRAIDDIAPALKETSLSRKLGALAREFASLGIHLLEDEDVQEMIIEGIRGKRIADGDA